MKRCDGCKKKKDELEPVILIINEKALKKFYRCADCVRIASDHIKACYENAAQN